MLNILFGIACIIAGVFLYYVCIEEGACDLLAPVGIAGCVLYFILDFTIGLSGFGWFFCFFLIATLMVMNTDAPPLECLALVLETLGLVLVGLINILTGEVLVKCLNLLPSLVWFGLFCFFLYITAKNLD